MARPGAAQAFDTRWPGSYAGRVTSRNGTPTSAERAVVVTLAGGLLLYAALALAAHRWISGLVAPLVAALLIARHPRARFSAYLFFSALAVRGLVAGAWALALFAGAAILAMQTPPAVRAWPRVVAGRTRPAGDASST
jgi:hypothetical protein